MCELFIYTIGRSSSVGKQGKSRSSPFLKYGAMWVKFVAQGNNGSF